jgi:hypothetical protein
MMRVKLRYSGIEKRHWIIVLLSLLACVDPIDFEVPPANEQIVVEGQITDEPGPYAVKLSRALSVDGETRVPEAILNAQVTLFDDNGSSEALVEQGDGIYTTTGLIQGEVGHRYHIRIETEGKIFESEPDLMTPVGEVTSIRYEYEARTKQLEYGEFPDDIFNIYIDAEAGPLAENLVRWRFKGTYKVLTNPELHMTLALEFWYPTPLPCSGHVILAVPGAPLVKQSECTCCTCWVNQNETAPQLSDMQLIDGSEFRNIKVGEVPINSATFFDRYLVEVEQISLSRTAFDFFRLIRAQKEGTMSLFQPPSAQIISNVKAINNSIPVAGIFYASSVKLKTLYILPDAVPYPLPPIDFVTTECYSYYENASTEKPVQWKD